MPERSSNTTTKAAPANAPPATGATPSGATPPRRKPGKAEPIPLKWKLVGIADGMIFTLLKATEKPPVEAELARLLEGASRYEQMEIYPIDAKVPIPAATAKRTSDAVARATTVINPRPKPKRGAAPKASKTAESLVSSLSASGCAFGSSSRRVLCGASGRFWVGPESPVPSAGLLCRPSCLTAK